jgi:DNA-binding CsgD family transcriptional regulator
MNVNRKIRYFRKMTTELTPKEQKMLRLICDEYSNAEIATKLDYKIRYTEKLKTALYRKTKTHSNIGLLKWALINGFYTIKVPRSKGKSK